MSSPTSCLFCLLLFARADAFATLRCALPPTALRSVTRPPVVATRRAAQVVRMATKVKDRGMYNATDDSSAALMRPEDMQRLRSRIARIQEDGLSSPAEKLFQLAMATPPQQLLRDFFKSSPSTVTQAMQDAVVSLLGALPPAEFDAQVTTTGDKLAALMLQLQMTGYMLRNAEYVQALRGVLELKTRSPREYRAAFDRIDLDSSGYIERTEIEALLGSVYDGEAPPFEVSSFLALFDTDNDGRIGWPEFAAALGMRHGDGGADGILGEPARRDADASESPTPQLSGEVTVTMDDGTELVMDASKYMEELKSEATALRAELGKLAAADAELDGPTSSSLSAYVSSLPEQQMAVLTGGISEDVVAAMKKLVAYILRAPAGDGPLAKEAEVTMDQDKLQQLCLYKLVLGYRLREAEAKGDAQKAIGF